MKAWWRFMVILIAVCLAFAMIVACGDDDDDDDSGDGDDDDGGNDNATGGDDCQSLCERGYACFGEDYWDYTDVSSLEECVQVCETDMLTVNPELAECIFGCASISGCDAWATCMAACAGY